MKKSMLGKCLTSTLAGVLAFAVSGCGSVANSSIDQRLTSQEIADLTMKWWPGDYNNAEQISFLKEDGAPIWKEGQHEDGQTFGGHLPVTSYYRTIDIPAFGEKVLYLEEFTFNDNPYRQRLYTIKVDQEDKVRVKLWYFPDKTTYANAWKNLSEVSKLTPDDMSPLPDSCDLIVHQQDDNRLHMMMPKDQCKFGKNIFDYQVSLSAEDFWFRDRIVDAETMEITMTAGGFTYHKLDKVVN